ncbi:19787_t:CDS:1 [Cetraspora pellucida]|uniref:19787_t:CDS:1 n=1 Tax=Cetraspora pellucida TaxID=1433469 RepID=A0A9N9I007_9GLOM|nr:19787_t:CDS:1 [Cetraspora pellucida]
MNLQTFNLFLIVLSILLISSITVDARFHKYINKHINKYDNKHTTAPTKPKCSTSTPTPECCQSRGGPGWNGLALLGSYEPVNITNAVDCCIYCTKDSSCHSWMFSSEALCAVGTSDVTCSSSIITPSSDIESGIAHCSSVSQC